MSFFDAEQFEALRAERGVTWGRPVRVMSEISSTNDQALAAISTPARTGIVWVARVQTAGRGRRGNRWEVPPGEGLTFSTLLRFMGPQERLFGLSLGVGLAVRDAVVGWFEGSGRQPLVEVKWPNDVLAEGKKLCGILIEMKKDEDGAWGLAVGIGLNVHTRDFPDQLRDATSLSLLGLPSGSLRFEPLLVDLLGTLEKRVGLFLTRGMSALLEDLSHCDFLKGKNVRVGDIEGEALGLDERGCLLVRDIGGATRAVDSGHVQLI